MTRQWSEWREHTAGAVCPIPDAKAGEWGFISVGSTGINHSGQDAIDCQWLGILYYRVLLPKPVKDLDSVARELSEALKPFAEYWDTAAFDINHRGELLPDEQGVGWVYLTNGNFRAARAALNTYQEMKK